MAWLRLKDGPAQSKDNASQQLYRVRGTPEGLHFSHISMSVTLRQGGSCILGASTKLQKATISFMFVPNGTTWLSLDTLS